MLQNKKISLEKSKQKQGKACYFLDLRNVGGARKFYHTKQEAEQALIKVKELNDKHLQESHTWTIKDLLGPFPNNEMRVEWDQRIKDNNPFRHFYWEEYTRMKKGKPLPQYFDSYKKVFESFLQIKIGMATVADLKVSDLTAQHCKTYIIPALENSGKKGKRSYKTLVAMRSMFNKLMKHAKVCGCIKENPMSDIVIERPYNDDQENKPQKEKLSTDFIHDIEKLLPKSVLLAYKFACSTGLRAGEQRALTWEDIDFKTFEVTVNKAAKIKVEGGVGRVKTRTSNRTVPIKNTLMRELQELYIKQGRPDQTHLVFGTKYNTMVNTSTWREQLQKVVRQLSNKNLTWHDLRHYYASKMLEFYGNDVWTVSNLMGHSDIAITQRTYGHWMQDIARKEKLRNDMAQINF